MSDVPEGYKLSKVGVIPEEWEVKTLGEKTTKIGSGITPTGGEKVYKSKGRPFLRSQNVGLGNLILKDIAFISDEIHNTFKATEIEKNDVFLNITGASIGRSAIADERVQNGNVNQHVCIIRTIEDELNPKFLNYFLLSKKGQKQIDSFQAGGNRQGLNFGQIKSFQIPFPPLSEQQAISSALNDVDALITALEQLITKKRNIKQGAMQQLLTGKKRLPGFSGEWEANLIESLTPLNKKYGIVDGPFGSNLKTIHYRKSGIPIITSGYVTEGIFIATDYLYVDIEKFKQEKRSAVYGGDIVMAKIGARCGASAILPKNHENGLLSGNALKITVDETKHSTYFIWQILWSIYTTGEVETLKSVGAQPAISMPNLKKFQMTLPPLPEQQAIAQILTDMDTEIESLKQKRNKYKAIKQGMMQELLTGKIRLI
jgi:type I restriction enzyme S subunit